MTALARPTISNPGRVQVRFEEPVPHDKVADVRQAALGVEEYKVQLVLAHCLVVPLHDVDRAGVDQCVAVGLVERVSDAVSA